ncbi:MAG: hypothetical protein E7679_07105 [Ruminococcaceae bacterium]|nr:hypothetical protein [Oscillospiraceae bacterium]
MKIFCRIAAFALATVMLLSMLVSCAPTDGGEGEQGQNTQAATVETDPYATKLPDKDWEGKELLVIGVRNDVQEHFSNFEIARDELPDDVVGKAVWDRNNALKAKYNFVIKQELVEDMEKDLLGKYNTGTELYDLAFYAIDGGFIHAQQGFLKDLREVEYVDLTHPSWNQYATEQLTISGRTFISTSDMTLKTLDTVYVTWYNREMARQNNLGQLEDMVKNNTWTLDNCYSILKGFADDADGDGSMGGKKDGFGLAADSREHTYAFIVGGGYRLTTNEDGDLKFVEADEKTKGIIDKVAKFAYNKDITMMAQTYGNDDSVWNLPADAFAEERALMRTGHLFSMRSRFLDMVQFEFGYLPFPKYDADQKEYYAPINVWNGSGVAVPGTVPDTKLDFVGFALQAMTEASTKTVYHAYYETKCKHQDSYDQLCADMLDIIFEHVVYDVGTIVDLGRTADDKRDGFYSVVTITLPTIRKNTYMTIYSKKADNAKGQLQDIINDFAAIE